MKLDAVQLLADAKVGLEALADALGDYRSGWGDQPRDAKAQLEAEVDRIYQADYQSDSFVPEINDHLDPAVLREFIELTGSCLTQSRVLGVLNETLADDAIIVAAAGSLPGDLQRSWRSKGVNTYHVEYGYSCMGYEVNAALGVKLAEPEREVYALVGDGSYMMLHSELATSIQERRKINVVLLDNMTFGCINNLQIGTRDGQLWHRVPLPQPRERQARRWPGAGGLRHERGGLWLQDLQGQQRGTVARRAGRCAYADGVDADRHQGAA